MIIHGVEEPVPGAGDVVTDGDVVTIGDDVVLVAGVDEVGFGGDTVINVPVTQALVRVIARDRTLQ
jgi:hypothetical protein